MGFFSWKTSDTLEEIWNCYTDKCKPVYMYFPNGDISLEEAYEGYGIVAGCDVHEELAIWNGYGRNRDMGIELECSNDYPHNVKFPLKFSFRSDKKYDDLDAAENADYQGYFDEEGEAEDECL